ncbi:MAG: hypothetical protein SFU87_14570 [Chitinophagaceae bacterium]|nr:hypothetical protein [Chitinophagaceae bacterium]
MKKLLSVLLLVSFAPGLLAQDKKEREPFIVKSLTGEAVKNVEVETSGGSITVDGTAGQQPRVEVYVWPSNSKWSETISKEEIQKRLDEDYELTISVSNNKLTATAKNKKRNWDWKRSLSISFKVYAGSNLSTRLRTSGGSIHLTALSGTQDFTTSGGSLHVDKLKGKINGRTSGGSIHVKDSNDEIDLTTSGGSIHADNCTGKIELTTSGGSLQLKNLSGTIEATTSGGSIRGGYISGELQTHTSGGNINLDELMCSIEASTSGGSIDVSVKELGKYVKLSNSGGNIDLELPSSKGLDLKLTGSKIKTDKLGNFSGSVEDDEINGKLNGGGTPITVRAGSGRIYMVLK